MVGNVLKRKVIEFAVKEMNSREMDFKGENIKSAKIDGSQVALEVRGGTMYFTFNDFLDNVLKGNFYY